MPKERKKFVRILIIGALVLVLTLAFIYVFFIYRKDTAYTSKEYPSAKRVLFISSYSESFETVDLQKAGIQEAFADQNIRLDIEYMDMKNYDQQKNEELFYQTLRYKLKNAPKYDSILLGDDAALHFAEKHQQELFSNIPMVFFCVNDKEYAIEAGENPYITGAVEDSYLKDTINLAIKLEPKAKKIIAIYDNSLTGQGDKKQFFAVEDSYPQYEFSGINSSEYTLDEFAAKLEALSSDSILIYMNRFQDSEGNQYTIPQSVQYIVAHTHIPVYRISIGGIGDGLIGGKMVSYEASGKMAASMVLDILNGTDIKDIPVVTKGEGQYYFDYQVMKKYDIDLSLLPKDAVILNKTQTLYERHKAIFIPVFLFAVVCLAALLIAITDNIKLRRLTGELQRSHDELKDTNQKLITAEEELKARYRENTEYTKHLEKKEEYIRYQAEHDYLTELPNRRAAMVALDKLIKSKADGTVVIIDIDDFKEVNDSYGHTCGDVVLKEISRRFLKLMDEGLFFAARLGGDEFLLILQDLEIEPNSRIMSQIRQIFEEPILFEEKEHYINVSMGISQFSSGDLEADGVVSNADYAMYAAKNAGKNESVYYNTHLRDKAVKRKEIKAILSDACKNDGFYVLYQPQIDIKTGMIAGYEALVRLKNHNISPAQFIAVAEETEIILTIGRIVTRKAVEQLAEWRSHGMLLHPVAINFSSKQIQDKEYVLYLKDLLTEYDISSELIEIEITESIFINNNENAMKLFEDFSSIGVRLALDDFGTGYSSINYLTYIPVEKIKLDKSLVDIYLKDGKDAFIENIIRLAHCLGLKITVEGIEEQDQCDRLKHFECDHIQGYYYSRPISGTEVEQLKNPIREERYFS